jgi:hypothetical protein
MEEFLMKFFAVAAYIMLSGSMITAAVGIYELAILYAMFALVFTVLYATKKICNEIQKIKKK